MLLHWSPRSPYVRKVVIALHEIGRLDEVELLRSVVPNPDKSLRIFQDNPLGKLPCLVPDDGAPIFGSPVILHYLDQTFAPGKLIPAAGPDRIWALQMQDIGDELLVGLRPWSRASQSPPEQQRVLIGSTPEKFEACLKYLEARAEALASKLFGVGQIGLGVMLAYADFRLPDVDWRAGRPRLAAWFKTLSARPSFEATKFEDESTSAFSQAAAAATPA